MKKERTPYALVTGAASGMGKVFARELLDRGHRAILADRNAEGLEEFEAVPGAVTVVLDLTAGAAVQRIRETVERENAYIDILINDAGMLFVTPTVDTPPEKLESMILLHCLVPVLLCREFVPEMIENGRGRILNISSISAWMDWPVIGMYGNTKRFVKGFSRSLRIETEGTGVTVSTAIFGAVDTPLFKFPDKMRRALLRCGIMMTPENAAGKALAACMKGRKRIIPGLVNKIIIPLTAIVPDFLLTAALRMYRKRFSPCDVG